MKKSGNSLFLTILSLFACACFASGAKAQDFSGSWKFEDEKVSFTMEIKQNGKKISGAYSYVTLPDAKRIREGKFTGEITGEMSEISFQNDEYETEKGTATLELVTETLVWTMPARIAGVLQIPASFDLEKQINKRRKQ